VLAKCTTFALTSRNEGIGTLAELKKQPNFHWLKKVDRFNPNASLKPTQNRGKTTYRIHAGWDIAGNRISKWITNEGEAKEALRLVLRGAEAASEGDKATLVNVAASHELQAAQLKLRAHGASVLQAVDWYIQWHQSIKEIVTVKEAYERWAEFHHFKTGQKSVSEKYWRTMCETYLRPLVKVYGERRLVDLTQSDFEHYLFKIKSGVKPSQKKEHRSKLKTWMAWCTERQIYSEQTKPLDKIKFGRDETNEEEDIRIIDPKVVRSMLDFCFESPKQRDWRIGTLIVLRVLCGVRAEEAIRLKWSSLKDIASEERVLRIPAHKAKKGYKRFPTVHPSAQEWLLFVRGKFGNSVNEKHDDWLMPANNDPATGITETGWRSTWQRWVKRWKEWAAAHKKPHANYRQNSLRDTFGSHGINVLGIDATMRAMGEKDSSTFYNHYYNASTKRDSEAFFSILPEGKTAVLDEDEISDPLAVCVELSEEEFKEKFSDAWVQGIKYITQTEGGGRRHVTYTCGQEGWTQVLNLN
jgi:integrase